MKKAPISNLFNNQRFLIAFSLVVAALSWLGVSIVSQPDTPRAISEVPVNFTQQTDALLDLGLNPILDTETTYVTINVRGPSTVVGKLTPEDFNVTVRLSGIVTDSGTYDLELVTTNATKEALGEGVKIEGISPSTIKVRFDRLSSQTFTIEPNVRGMSVPPDYVVIEQAKVTPSKVTVSGPQADLDRIEKAVVTVDLSEPLTRPYADARPIVLLDAEGKEIHPETRHLVLDQNEAQLTVPVKKLNTLPLVVGFTNVPSSFPLEELENRMILSTDTLTVAGPVDVTDNYTELQLGYIDLRTLTPDNNSYEFPVVLPSSGFSNVDNIDTVTVDFDTENWASQDFHVNITTTTPPSHFHVEVLTNALSNVTLVGEKDVLNGVTASDIVAVVDLSEKALQVGQYSYPVKISIPTKGMVWSVGEYFAIIQVTEADNSE